jgi:uncharacterized protein (TIGR00730 family)
MRIKAIAVFCGSKNGNNPLYARHASALGEILAQNNVMLIYGGGSTGIMGAIADTVIDNNGKVTGVIPKVLVDWERQHENITELIVVEDMHSRKKKLYELCDAAVILPGGFGTLDELFEMLTWNQLSIHNKPIFFINSNGFYNHLINHINSLQEQGFLYDQPEERITILDEPSQLVQYLL